MVLERCTNAVASPFGVTGAIPGVIFSSVVPLTRERGDHRHQTRGGGRSTQVFLHTPVWLSAQTFVLLR